ncbi:MAG TPA: hypothetical protein VHZ03_38210 [Trebonia sp.]|jgi:hypothetical protein|nr:hypothetical protein [Trebonia sp.]
MTQANEPRARTPEEAPRAPLAHTPEEAAAIIGGGIKASYLKALARKREIPALWVGKWAFLDEDIAAIIAYCRRPAREAAQPSAARPTPAPRRPVLPAPVPGREPVHLKARPMRNQGRRPARDDDPGTT